MPLLAVLLCAIALLPWAAPIAPSTALVLQAALAALALPLAWIWGKGRRLPTLPTLAALPLFAAGFPGALALLAAGTGMAIGRVGQPKALPSAIAGTVGALGVAACLLPNTQVPPLAAAGMATFLLAAGFHPRGGLLVAALAGLGVGLAWGVVGEGGAPIAAALAVASTFMGLRAGWRHGLTAALALAAGAMTGTAIGGWTTPDPLALLLAWAAGSVVAWTAAPAGKTTMAALTTLAVAATPMGALWAIPALAIAASWSVPLRPRLASFLAPHDHTAGTATTQRREPPPPRALHAAPAASIVLEAAA